MSVLLEVALGGAVGYLALAVLAALSVVAGGLADDFYGRSRTTGELQSDRKGVA